MNAEDQIVLVVTGYTYHTNSDCAHVRSKQGRMLRRGDAESRGFKLCRACAARERRDEA